jgi:hypothetical protein
MRKALLFFTIIIAGFVYAADPVGNVITGKVIDNKTSEPLIGSTVTLTGNHKTLVSKTTLDGSYQFKNVQQGIYNIKVEYVGYDDFITKIEAKTGARSNLIVKLTIHNSELNNVIIKSRLNKESDDYARKTEKTADNVMNVISAKSIEISPDITVGNVLQRAAGVSVIKNNGGEGHYAIIRGMDNRYNYTTINGIKIPSPDDKTRSVPLDIFPSDLLERLEVVKSLTPSMEGDAIGGVTNMVLKDAPKQLVFTVTGFAGYNSFLGNHNFTTFNRSGASFKTPYEINGSGYVPKPSDFNVKYLNYSNINLPVNSSVNASIGKSINKKTGFIAAVTYQHLYKGSSSLFYPPSGQPQPQPVSNFPVFDPIEYREYYNLQSRFGSHLKLNYNLNNKNRISFYTAYFQLDQKQHRVLQKGLAKYNHIPGQIFVYDRSLFERQIIWNNTLQGKHDVTDRLGVDWSLVYSQAQSKIPIWIDQEYSDILSYNTSGNLVSESKYLIDFPFNFTHAKETDRSAYLNANYILLPTVKLSAGGMYRNKNKDNVFEAYKLFANNQPFTTIDQASFPRLSWVDTTDGNTYQSKENILAFYTQLKWTSAKWEAVGGVRVENTNHSYNSALSIYLPGKSANYSYYDVLPSINVKYKLSENNALRASYFSGISRPNYFEYIPVVKSGDYFDQKGNPSISHVQSHNADLRYEHFLGYEDYFMIGTFYKYIINPIEYSMIPVTTGAYVFQPQNFGNATNYGIELVFTKHIKNFRINGNYSYTQSSITTTKSVYAIDNAGNFYNYLTNQTRPLQGQSDHIANLSVYYKSAKRGIETQISWVYTGKRIDYISPYKDLDYWQRATSVIDFSIEKRIARKFTVFAKATNLTNNPTILELHTSANGYYYNNPNYPEQTSRKNVVVKRDIYNQTFSIGFRYK